LELADPWFNWMIHYEMTEFAFHDPRSKGYLPQWDHADRGISMTKGYLSIKEEIIGNDELWNCLTQNYPLLFPSASPRSGAMNLVKRLWRHAEVINNKSRQGKFETDDRQFDMIHLIPNELMIITSPHDNADEVLNENISSPYHAVILMDGDEMRQWLNGQLSPSFLKQLTPDMALYFEELIQGRRWWTIGEEIRISREGTKGKEEPEITSANHLTGHIGWSRPFLPAHHLEFSAALANYAIHVVPLVLDHYQGSCIHASGDTVLALTAAGKAVSCASTLRAGFRGRKDDLYSPISTTSDIHDCFQLNDGFLRLNNLPYPLMVPGPQTEISAGIAIGHEQCPLPELAAAAKNALIRAKTTCGRAAIAVTALTPDSGCLQWDANWNSGALPLFFAIQSPSVMAENRQSVTTTGTDSNLPVLTLSHPFFRVLSERLYPYRFKDCEPPAAGFDVRKIMQMEFERSLPLLHPNGDWSKSREILALKSLAFNYLDHLTKQSAKIGHLGPMADFERLLYLAAYLNGLES
jgi:hypothetical protein